MRRWWLVVLVVLAGCPSGREAPPSDPPLPTATTTVETTTTTGAGFAVPAVIDVAYAQRVLTELYHLEGEVARHVHRTRKLDAEFTERIEAIYGAAELKAAQEEFQRDAAIGFAGYSDPPGDPIVTVHEVIDSSPTCMVVRADVDRRPLYSNPVSVGRNVIHEMADATIERFNATGWGTLIAGAPNPADQRLDVC